MRVLVTGGGGFLGKEIIRQLLNEDCEIRSLSRSDYPELRNWGVHHIQGDITNIEDCVRACEDVDIVIHAAALASMWGRYETFFNINFTGTKNLLEASVSQNVDYFIYTSSPSAIFGNQDIENADESIEYPRKFYSYYAQTKAFAERLVLGMNNKRIKTLALRPHIIWGKGDPHLVPRLVQRHRQGRFKQIGSGQNQVDIVHVKNAAYAHILAMKQLINGHNGGEAYFIGQGPVNLWNFVNLIFNQLGLPPLKSKISFKLAYVLGAFFELIYRSLNIYKSEPPMTRFVAMQLGKSHYFKHDKAERELGYQPIVSIEEGLKELTLDDFVS